ncbi:MAG: hypothetical protein AABX31_00775 [Nanoarchaeota archaeon]
MGKLVVIGFLFLCLCSILVSAQDPENQTKAITLTANVDKILYSNTEYTSLFKLEITGKKPCSPKDTVTVLYTLTKNNSLVKEDFFSKEIGCTSSAGTGKFSPTEIGMYSLCGAIINSSVIGNYSSPPSCTEFEVISTSEVSCDISLQLKTNESIFYESGQSIEFKPELNDKSFPFVIEYWIEDLFGNQVRPKINTTNTNEKSWKTNIKEQDRVLFLKAAAYPSCNDLDLSNNAVQEMFIVTNDELTIINTSEKSSPEESSSTASAVNSTINIIKISPEMVSFGKTVEVELEIYKGATGKYSVSVWAEKNGKVISEKTKVHLKNKDTSYKFTLPIFIEPNCNQKIKEGDVQLIVEGLGLQEEKEFEITGINSKICPEKETLKKDEPPKEKSAKTEETKKQTKTANQSLSLLSQSGDTQPSLTVAKAPRTEIPGYSGMVVYESVSEKSKNLVSWVLFVAFGLLSLILILKKNSD